MALETVIYPHTQLGANYDYLLKQDNVDHDHDHIFGGFLDHNTTTINHHYDQEYSSSHVHDQYYWDPRSSSPEDWTTMAGGFTIGEMGSLPHYVMKIESPTTATVTNTVGVEAGGRKRRRRAKSGKNKEELEDQRMTHITVERNRRKQMNEYLAVIRSLMPSSYVQRGDQASIVGGAINFVKDLEQQLQTLEVQKRANGGNYTTTSPPSPQPPFCDFFTFPQYSIHHEARGDGGGAAKNRLPAMADIEVTLVEGQANVKILSKKRHRQLLKLVASIKSLRLTILHLNVTTTHEELVLYTLSVKLEDGCQLNTVDDIADAINCLLTRIEEESHEALFN